LGYHTQQLKKTDRLRCIIPLDSPSHRSRISAIWQYPGFRHAQRLSTTVWGAGFLGEAILRVVLTSLLPVDVMVLITQILPLVVTAGLIAWTISYGKRARAR
jgi:hypothetical protein